MFFWNQIKCEQTKYLIQTYLDGEMSQKEVIKLTKHLERCTPCDKDRYVYMKIKQSLKMRSIQVNPEVINSLHNYVRRLDEF